MCLGASYTRGRQPIRGRQPQVFRTQDRDVRGDSVCEPTIDAGVDAVAVAPWRRRRLWRWRWAVARAVEVEVCGAVRSTSAQGAWLVSEPVGPVWDVGNLKPSSPRPSTSPVLRSQIPKCPPPPHPQHVHWRGSNHYGWVPDSHTQGYTTQQRCLEGERRTRRSSPTPHNEVKVCTNQ